MKTRILTLALLLALALTGCAAFSGSNGFLDGASPSTSALALYSYDGEVVTRRFLFDQAQEVKLLSALDRVRATSVTDWQPTDAAAPIYGIEIGGKDGYDVRGAWSDGYWIMPSGEAFRFDFDFAALEDSYDWDAESVDEFASFGVMPCSRVMTQDADGWNTALLSEAAPLDAPEGVSMALKSDGGDAISVTLTNCSEEEWCFGEHFSVEARIGGVWYEIPADSPLCFTDIGYLLPAGSSTEHSYPVSSYGTLPAGTYRLRVEGMAVEFER